MFHTSVHSIQVVLPRIIINIIIICASSLYFADNNQSVKTMQNNQNEGNRVCHKHSYSLIRFVLNNNKNIDSVDAFSDDIGREYKRSKKTKFNFKSNFPYFTQHKSHRRHIQAISIYAFNQNKEIVFEKSIRQNSI